MFFSWYIKNKQFKRGSGLSGQIAPFLIIILAVLLIAAITTVNIGRVSLDKTCSANGADAGSLSAATVLAAAFNKLALINREMNVYYDVNRFAFEQAKNTADQYLTQAIIFSSLTTASAIAAAVLIRSTDRIECFSPFVAFVIAAALNGIGAGAALMAQMAVSSLNIYAQGMQSITDIFYTQQQQNYCAAVTYMGEAYTNAGETGLSYAYANSCISAKLSDAQNNAFSAWLTGSPSGSYSWPDSAGQTHTVSVALNLPNIVSYDLQHTVGGYNDISDLLKNVIDTSAIVAPVFASVASMLAANVVLAVAAFALSMIAFVLLQVEITIPIGEAICAIASFIAGIVEASQSMLVSILIAAVGAAGTVVLFLLKGKLQEALEDWNPDGMQASTGCGDVADLMIIKISAVNLSRDWTAICTVNQIHPASAGIVSTAYPLAGIGSVSRSKFDGGVVGSFQNTFDSSIQSVL